MALQALARRLAEPPALRLAVHQHAGGRRRAAPHPPAQLVQLRQAEALGMLDHHQRGIGHVHPDLDHRGGHQHAHQPLLEQVHHRLFLGRRHARVQQADHHARQRG
jgi:hypothetical protein